jgi:2-polyprenyl-3-methyl-5-hydroxy-6-metoxy-1,4-benzoquinol methylase
MKKVDRFLQGWRQRVAIQHIPKNARVLDIGAHEGELFKRLGAELAEGCGIEPLLQIPTQNEKYILIPGFFPEAAPETKDWDVITALAVFEHIPKSQQEAFVFACHRYLKIGGRVILSVPGPLVDLLLAALSFFRLVDGMSLEEHYGFEAKETPSIFEKTGLFKLEKHQNFELGINNLFVFRRL